MFSLYKEVNMLSAVYAKQVSSRMNMSGYALNTGFKYYPQKTNSYQRGGSVILRGFHSDIREHLRKYKLVSTLRPSLQYSSGLFLQSTIFIITHLIHDRCTSKSW